MQQKKKLLIVDDNESNRKVLCKILEFRYQLLTAGNGQEALTILEKEKETISVVLLDLLMPVMNGYDVMEIMSRDSALSKIPVIVTTGVTDERAEEKALGLGANDFILKPYKPVVILHRIANTINLRESAALINMVQKDEQTGVLSKSFFYQQVEDYLTDHPDTACDLICSDIERFKLVNDMFGSQVGDQLLKYTAEQVSHMRDDVLFCGRIGVDQFAVLLPHQEHYWKQFFDALNLKVNQFPIGIGLNIRYGIYEIQDITVPVSAMCDRAMIACASTKGIYDVCYTYYNDRLRRELHVEQSILDTMEKGIKEKQFKVYFQPKYEVATDKIAGAEALVRWEHPTMGFLGPGQFIPLFEKNGFITQLDFYVWETVCATMREWLDSNKSIVPISVNVSRADLYYPDLPDVIWKMIQKYKLKPSDLHLEITETAYTDNQERLIEVVGKLKKLGFIIEMDDFGAGYSSLNVLSKVPLDVVKLDMKLVQTETAKESSKSILGFIISLTKWLNLPVVAEGVETREQLDMLRNMECTYVQGYFYTRPMPLEEFEAHLLGSEVADPEWRQPDFQETTLTITESQFKRVMLIVDDVEMNRAVLASIFADDYTIVEATNGKSAYEYVLENYEHIDVILLDLVMPVMDGFQMIEKLKKDETLKHIPVIVTSQTGEDSELQALTMGASDFINKPYNTEVARHRVNNVLAESKLRVVERERELSHAVEEMRYKAEHDSLTGLYNRTALESYINAHFAESKTGNGSFLMIDLDNFKMINDFLGHDRGDEVLVDVAHILERQFRKSDIVSRLGGDEFAIFVPALPSISVLREKMQSLCQKLQLTYEGIEISATIGIAVAPKQGSDYQTLYKKADTALLTAKRLGKNRYQIYNDETEMPTPVLTRNLDWLLDETSDGVVVCDTDTYEILYMNQAAQEISGEDKEGPKQGKCYEKLWGRQSPCDYCYPLDKMACEYQEKSIVDTRTNKNYLIKGKVAEWNGRNARIQFLQDDTEKMLAADRLMTISQDRKRLLDLMPGGIFRYHADPEDDTFDFVSNNMLKMLGYSREDFEEKFHNQFQYLIWHEDRERVLKEIEEQIAVGDMDECDYRIEKGDGTLCWVHDVGHLVVDEDGQSWFYVMIVDMTKKVLL